MFRSLIHAGNVPERSLYDKSLHKFEDVNFIFYPLTARDAILYHDASLFH